MFSVQGDVILDPFLGTGTTTLGAMSSGRSSIGFEIDLNFKEFIDERLQEIKEITNEYVKLRLERHLEFIKKRQEEDKEIKYTNKNYNFPVVTRQETNLYIPMIKEIVKKEKNLFEVEHLF